MALMRDGAAVAAQNGLDLFLSAEEAWFWGVQGMSSRLAGARVLPGMARLARPCEASDIINCAARLRRDRRLSATEVGVLFLYGRYAVPPHALGGRHRAAVRAWEHAMALLGDILEQKGIIEPSRADCRHDR